MIAQDRMALINELARKQRWVVVSELSEMCNVTEETIRKDLSKMEARGILTRVHGGAVLNRDFVESRNPERRELAAGNHFLRRMNTNPTEKDVIAGHVAGLLEGCNTLFMDSSTTVAAAMRALPQEAEVTIVTNSVYPFTVNSARRFSIISTGGVYNWKYMSLQGPVAKECIGKYNVDVALISCRALNPERGVQDSNEGEAEIKIHMIEHSRKVVLLADHTKFDQSAFVRLMDADNVDCIVTDRDPGEAWRSFCEAHQVQLVF